MELAKRRNSIFQVRKSGEIKLPQKITFKVHINLSLEKPYFLIKVVLYLSYF